MLPMRMALPLQFIRAHPLAYMAANTAPCGARKQLRFDAVRFEDL